MKISFVNIYERGFLCFFIIKCSFPLCFCICVHVCLLEPYFSFFFPVKVAVFCGENLNLIWLIIVYFFIIAKYRKLGLWSVL